MKLLFFERMAEHSASPDARVDDW
jgi:hypothetical protein